MTWLPEGPFWLVWLVPLAIVSLAGVVHGALGLGFPMVATPLLALVTDVRTAILVTLLPTVTVNLASLLTAGDPRPGLARHWPIALYAVVGSALGTALLVSVDPGPFRLLLAGLVLGYLNVRRLDGRVSLAGLRRHPRWAHCGVGLLAGLFAGTTNVMVPVLIVYALEVSLPMGAAVQLFNLCFLGGKIAQTATFGSAGVPVGGVLAATIPLAATALATLLCGVWLRRRMDTGKYEVWLRRLLYLTALLLIAQFVWDTWH